MANKTQTLPQYRLVATTDHDQKVKLGKHEIFCYSKKQMDKIHPEKDYRIVGEARTNTKKYAVARLRAGEQSFKVFELKTFSRILNGVSGYARVSEKEYVALLRSRVPFLILLFFCLAGLIGAATVLLNSMTAEPPPPVIIDPDHPMPSQDVNSTPNEDDDTEKAEVAEGGGSLSMIYALEAELDLNTGEIQIYFKNPNASTHDVSLILYVVSGETEVAIAQSGRISAGYTLDRLQMVEEAAVLSEGVYTGYFLLSLFDPETGERALVQPQITGVELIVSR